MINSVQYLRAIAAIFVVISHISIKGGQYSLDAFSWFHIGASGVDLFFIISGFIMCYTTDNKDIGFAKFITARFRRILPLYWVMTSLALVVFLITPSLVNSSGGATSIFSSYTLIPDGNKYLVQNGWTLSFEFFFYFIFGFALLFGRNNLLLSSLFISLLCVSGLLFLNPTENNAPLLRFITAPILLEFILGILAFVILKKIKIPLPIRIIMIGLGVVLMLLQNNFGPYANPLGRALYSGLPMFLIFVGCVSFEHLLSPYSKTLPMRALELLGNSSYSLYLVHPFVLSPVAIIGNKIGLFKLTSVFSFMMIITAIIAGVVVYLFIEKPIDKLLRRKKINTLSKVSG